jgi:hypothetical protein
VKKTARTDTGRDDVMLVHEWRRNEAKRIGLTSTQAMIVATNPHIDLRRLEKMIDDGCPPTVALRIER